MKYQDGCLRFSKIPLTKKFFCIIRALIYNICVNF